MSQDDYPIIIPMKGRSDPPISPVVVLVFTIEDFHLIRKRFEASIILEKELYNATLMNIERDGRLLTAVGPMVGAPQAVLIIEKLIAMGARDFLAMGWCGSLSPSVRIGDVVVAESALSDEGTSKHYPVEGIRVEANRELLRILVEKLRSEGLPFHVGRVWSTDAPYREMASRVIDCRKQGVLAVDMETSAMFQVAAFRGVRMSVVLVVSDELFTLKWKPGFRSKKFIDNREMVTNIILEIEKLLSETDNGNMW